MSKKAAPDGLKYTKPHDMRTKGQKIFNVFNIAFMIILLIITLYPFFYVICASFSDAKELLKWRGPLWGILQPATLDGYHLTFINENIPLGFANTVKYVISGTLLSLALTIAAAFVITRRHFMPRKIITTIILIPMFFSGGIIPLYFVVRDIGIFDTGWTMILPWAISSYNVIIMRTFFAGIPKDLEESAIIDGANDLHVLLHIIFPLSSAVIAVITLYYAVGLWNSWYPALMFMRDRGNYPIQMFLREILIANQASSSASASASTMVTEVYTRELVKYCTVVVSTVPIVVIYPFLQKYFVKGVMIGAVKG